MSKPKIAGIYSVAAAVLALMAQAVSAAGPTPQQVISNMRKAYSSLRSFEMTGTAVETVSMAGQKNSSSGQYKVLFQRPSKIRYLVSRGKHQNLVVSDGKALYVLPSQAKNYRRIPIKSGLQDIASLGGHGVNSLVLLSGKDFSKVIYNPKIVAQKKVGGVDTYVLQFALDKQGRGIQKLWVGKKDWLVRRNELQITMPLQAKGKSGAKTQNMVQSSVSTVTHMRPNAPISASNFIFKAPKGVTQFDPKKAAAAQQKKIASMGNALHGKPAPAFTLTDIKGNKVTLSSFKGKVVILNFCAFGHPLIAKELQKFQSSYDTRKKDGLAVIVITSNSAADAKKYAAKEKLTYPILTGSTQTLAQIAKSYRVVGVPTSYIIDRSCKIVDHFAGPPAGTQLDTALKKAGL